MKDDQWQPIETAPTGKRVLLTNNITATDATGEMSHIWIGFPIRSATPDQDGEFCTFDDDWVQVRFLTHWMPLPAPPALAALLDPAPVDPSPLASALIPDSWLDPLLTGPSAVIGKPPYDCKDIERLLWAIRGRLQAARVDPSPLAQLSENKDDQARVAGDTQVLRRQDLPQSGHGR